MWNAYNFLNVRQLFDAAKFLIKFVFPIIIKSLRLRFSTGRNKIFQYILLEKIISTSENVILQVKVFSEIQMVKERMPLTCGDSPVCVRTPLFDFDFAAVCNHFFWVLHVKDPKLSVNFCACFNPILKGNCTFFQYNLLQKGKQVCVISL